MTALDTNVLIYRLDSHDRIKQAKARALVRSLRPGPVPTVILWQVLAELMRQLRSWQDHGRLTRPRAAELCGSDSQGLSTHPADAERR